MSKKWVVFDFCETLVNLQSADAFVDFATQNERQKWRGFIRKLIGIFGVFKVFALVQKVFPEYSLEKRMRLFLLRGLSVEVLERRAQEFVDSVLVANENLALVERLKAHQQQGDVVGISSGGLRIYLTYWAVKNGISELDATDISFKNGYATGFISGADCMYEEKVNRLNHALKYTKSREGLFRVVYSDSLSDLPLFQWADEAWVVSYEKERNWVKINNFKEIVIGRSNGGLEV
jgi:HAD superfamily hydrolase (TIGR01490 family)